MATNAAKSRVAGSAQVRKRTRNEVKSDIVQTNTAGFTAQQQPLSPKGAPQASVAQDGLVGGQIERAH